jgi:TusA-related sulfurtransferase
MSQLLDLRGVSCPMNFVKTKLFLDKLASGTVIEVILDAGEPIESVFSSISAEGHLVEEPKPKAEGGFSLIIQKV